jgi:hypothetical protein
VVKILIGILNTIEHSFQRNYSVFDIMSRLSLCKALNNTDGQDKVSGIIGRKLSLLNIFLGTLLEM